MRGLKSCMFILLFLSSFTFASQNVIFTGNLSLNGVGIEADSAHLHIYYYGNLVDSINVTQQDVKIGNGLYVYKYTPNSDSAIGWSGLFTFVDAANSIHVTDFAIVTTAPDSIIADTTGIPASVYAEFINGSNEDQFKATGFSTHGAGDIWDVTTDGHTGAGAFGKMLETCSTDVVNLNGWNPSSENLARDATKTNYMADVLALALEASLVDTTDIKNALLYWLDKLVTTDNLNAVRYISPDGDNSNGLSLASAWTDFDSIGNLNAPTKILVLPGTYTEVACTVRTSGLELIGVGGAGITALRGTVDTTAYQDRIIVVNPRDSMLASLRISGFNFAYEVPDKTHDPNFKCAIYIQDSVRYVEIDNNLFIADSNFKTITTASDYIQYIYIHDNMFAGNKVHAIDIAPEYSVISNNYFMKMDSTMNDRVRIAIQLYTGARWNIIEGNYFVEDVSSITMIGADSNLIANNYFGINRSTASEMSGDANSAGNVFTGNHGEPHIKLRESSTGDEIGTWEDRFYNMMKILMFQPPTLSVIPNGDFQLIANPPDSTILEAWGSSSGTVYVTGRRSLGALPRSLYMESPTYQNTRDIYLHKGLHEVAMWPWLAQNTDEAKIYCYNDEDAQQTWADGGTYVSGTGYTGWQRIGGMIYLPADDYYYFSLTTPDSMYVTGFTVHPNISGDSTNAAIADANKINFKADVSGLSTFDHSTDKVTLVDSSADGIHDAEVAANAVRDSAQYLVTADLSTLNDPSITEIRQALHDSLYTVRVDSILSILGTVTADILDIAYYWGACDGCYYRLFPEGGTPNKDSAIMIDPSRGADSLVGKIIYLHGTEDDVVDSAYFYRDEPW